MKDSIKNNLQGPLFYCRSNLITEVNDKFIGLTKFSRNELIGKSLIELSEMLKLNFQYNLENAENDYKSVIFTKDHLVKEVDITCKLIEENFKIFFFNERSHLCFETLSPWIEQLYNENQKLEESLKTQEEYFANISHELKTPLNLIFSTAQLFNLYFNNDSLLIDKNKANEYIHTIIQNCYRLTKLINNIVDFSKIESGFFELNLGNHNIVNIVEDIVQSVSGYVESKEMHIIFDTNVEEKIIACDPDKIERVILNLISNAIKFSRSGDIIYVNLINKNSKVYIIVKDTGIGIDQEDLDTIFDRYKQIDKSFRNYEGSGIGLCLVKSIVEMHGGQINVNSKLNEGTEFIIEFPSYKIQDVKSEFQHKEESNMIKSNVEMIKIEFSDIYSAVY